MTQSTNLKLDLLSATDLFDTDKIKSNFEKIDSNVLIPTKIIDNCVTDNSLLPLSAKQGKLLQDQITKLNGDFQSDWIPLAPYYVNGWQDNGPSLYRKIGNCYLVKLSARNGNYETDLDICRNLPFSGSGICVNCFYNVNPDGNGIQVSGNKLFIVRKPTVSMDTIFANFIVGSDV